jgi:hypothetical protein
MSTYCQMQPFSQFDASWNIDCLPLNRSWGLRLQFLDKSSDVKIEKFRKKLFLPMKGVQSGYNFDKCLETNSGNIAKEIYHIATSSTIVQLSIFSNLFHKRFKKKPYLESLLETLQWYYIAMEEYPNQYHLFSAVENLYCVRCSWCHQPVTSANYIDNTFMKAAICAPLGARAYPWILSKYFLTVRPCVRPSIRPSVPLQISVGCVYFV